MLARAFSPHLTRFGEGTREVARHFAANEMESIIGGAFADKTRACAFFRRVRDKNPKLLFGIVHPDWMDGLIDALTGMPASEYDVEQSVED
jgi:hypothetical protein